MIHPAEVKKHLKLLQQIPSQQPAQNTHKGLDFIHNFWCEPVEAQMETGRSAATNSVSVAQ